jgi:hypothetical protein
MSDDRNARCVDASVPAASSEAGKELLSPDTAPLEDFLGERAQWFTFTLVHQDHGWDVALRIDGTYRYKQDAQRVARRLALQLERVLPPAVLARWRRRAPRRAIYPPRRTAAAIRKDLPQKP